jgi:hypothetical protein
MGLYTCCYGNKTQALSFRTLGSILNYFWNKVRFLRTNNTLQACVWTGLLNTVLVLPVLVLSLTLCMSQRDWLTDFRSITWGLNTEIGHDSNNIVTNSRVLFHDGSLLHSKLNIQQSITISNSCRTVTHGTYRNTTAYYNPCNGSTGF